MASIRNRTQKKIIMKTRVTYVIVLTLLMFSCTEKKNNSEVIQPVEFSTLSQGDLNGNGDEGIEKSKLIITDKKVFTVLLSKMNTINDEVSPIPMVDFDENIVLAVFDDVKSHGGHSIDITKVTEQEDRFLVQIERLNTGGMLTVITQPYHLVMIPKTTKPIIFKEI